MKSSSAQSSTTGLSPRGSISWGPVVLDEFASLFQTRYPQSGADRRTVVLLALVVAAGAAVRFWGLGAVGLHGDEKTMGLPAMHLVEHGSPLLPSGMLYPRALAQLYLMAACVAVFGKSEWALRLPSALCGVLLIVLTWTSGRRFLTPLWNLALTAAVALLPDFIEDAQTARMYVFLTTSVAGFTTLIFAWERTGRVGCLVAAVAVMLVGLQFHTLAIFAAPLVFMPSLLAPPTKSSSARSSSTDGSARGSISWGPLTGCRRRLVAGALAFALIVAGFVAIDAWITSQYPQAVAAEAGAVRNGPHAALIPHLSWLWYAVAALPALAFAMLILRGRAAAAPRTAATVKWTEACATALLASAIVAELALSFHLAALLAIAALVVARRERQLPVARIALFVAASLAVAALEAAYLYSHSAGSLRQIGGALLGWPSVWPLVSIAQYSVIAALLVAGAGIHGLWRVAHRKPLPDHLLLIVLGVWMPLLMIGLMRWDIPPRYAQAQLMPMLIGAFAAAQAAAQWLSGRLAAGADQGSATPRAPRWATAAAAVTCVLVVNPSRAARAVNSGYARHPDHKGAAEFIAALQRGPHDIIVAEDVLEQTYYLGHVDYWLVNSQVAAPFMHRVRGEWRDFYTDTPLLGSGQELEQLLEKPDRGALYIIGSGENQEDGRGLMRSRGIAEALESPRLHVVYRGRDGVTRVWKADALQRAVAAAERR